MSSFTWPSDGSGGGSGTVTSIALTAPSIFVVSGSPITTSGTIAITLNTESANTVFAGPTTGAAATPTFRSLVVADLPTAIPLANLATEANNTILGNNSGVTGVPLALTVAQVNAILPVFTSTLNGLAPLSGGGTTNYLRADGSWAAPPGATSGTVTSVGFSVPASSIFAATGSPVTSSGTLGFTVTGVSGGIPYFDSTSTLHTSSVFTTNAILVGGGVGNSPSFLGSLGTTTTVLHGNAGGAPTFGAVSLTADVSGLLPLANGGTNANLTAANGAIPYSTASAIALLAPGSSGQVLLSGGPGAPTWGAAPLTNPMTTGGDIIYGGASGVPTRLANGSAGQYLASGGGTAAPVWTTVKAPTIQKFTSGSGTYTTPTSPVPLYIRVVMVGGGAGAAGSGSSPGSVTAGGNTTFGTTLLAANGGALASGFNGGAGGTASLGSGPVGIAIQGGQAGGSSASLNTTLGGMGGVSFLGGNGSGGIISGNGSAAAANSGSGGGGAGGNGTTTGPNPGGGAGGYVDAIITSPTTTYSYAVGVGGTGGTAGGSGFAGGNGGSGLVVVYEYYQ